MRVGCLDVGFWEGVRVELFVEFMMGSYIRFVEIGFMLLYVRVVVRLMCFFVVSLCLEVFLVLFLV